MDENLSLMSFLVHSGLLEQEESEVILENAQFFGLCPGDILLANHRLSSDLIIYAAELLALQKGEKISMDTAIQYLKCAYWEYMVNRESPTIETPEKLGALLVEAGLINKKQLAAALISSNEFNVRLGQRLILRGLVEAQHIESFLNFQQHAHVHV